MTVQCNVLLQEYPLCDDPVDIVVDYNPDIIPSDCIYFRNVDVDIYIAKDGKHISLIFDETWQDYDMLARYALPFALPLHGVVVLHAVAHAQSQQVKAVIGRSGAGKSTLGQALSLSNADVEIIADDLLPLVADGDRIYVYRQEALTLTHVLFLERDAQLSKPQLDPLTPINTLMMLLKHAFGELKHATIWKEQFQLFEKIANTLPGTNLIIPDDLSKLEETIQVILGLEQS